MPRIVTSARTSLGGGKLPRLECIPGQPVEVDAALLDQYLDAGRGHGRGWLDGGLLRILADDATPTPPVTPDVQLPDDAQAAPDDAAQATAPRRRGRRARVTVDAPATTDEGQQTPEG